VAKEKLLYSIQSVESALSILEALSEAGDEVRLTHLSERLNMNKGRVFRFLATFEQRGYIERIGTSSRYRLGVSAFETGQKILLRMGLLRQARPVMERLARQCDEAVYLAIPRAEQILLLAVANTGQPVTTVSLVGRRFPLESTAPGRAVLQGRSGAYGRRGGSSWLETAGHDELGQGVFSLAVPIWDAKGDVPGSLCLVGPDYRFNRERAEQELLPLLRESAAIISTTLGYISH
jgi:IclR family transcriptional regulator, KDG regulon repressor